MKARVDVNVVCPGCGNLMQRVDISPRLRDQDYYQCLAYSCEHFGKQFVAQQAPEVELFEPDPAIARIDLYDQALADEGGV